MSDIVSELRPFEEAARRLEGWTFEYEPDVLDGDVPWSYEQIASDMVEVSDCVLDLGTGGGEAFSRILSGKRCQAFATEEWSRNAPIAAQCLTSVAPVTRSSSLSLPFRSESFDLVLARHTAIDPIEVDLVLRPGGVFLSQQVIHDFMFEIEAFFPDTTIFPNFFMNYRERFSRLGLQEVRVEEFRYKIQFRELGHLVYQLVAAPWTVPGFSVDTHLDGLKKLEERSRRGHGLEFTAGYYLLQFEKGEGRAGSSFLK